MSSERTTGDERGTHQSLPLTVVGLRIVGIASMIAVVLLIVQGMANLPWYIDASIAAAAILGWIYFFERT